MQGQDSVVPTRQPHLRTTGVCTPAALQMTTIEAALPEQRPYRFQTFQLSITEGSYLVAWTGLILKHFLLFGLEVQLSMDALSSMGLFVAAVEKQRADGPREAGRLPLPSSRHTVALETAGETCDMGTLRFPHKHETTKAGFYRLQNWPMVLGGALPTKHLHSTPKKFQRFYQLPFPNPPPPNQHGT